MDLLDPATVAILNAYRVTRRVILTVPLITWVHVHRKHRSFKELMRR
jgi:hypothetical protein